MFATEKSGDMARYLFILFFCSSCLTYLVSAATAVESVGPELSSTAKPNILLVVADDLGFLDTGAYGGEIRTPHIDSLASAGVRFTNFYTAATCSPTRAMLLTGVDSHAAGLGNMAEHLAPNQKGIEGYEGHLSERVVTVASLLQDAGYRTIMAGKWHLGHESNQLPVNRGFDKSIALLHGGASYFDDMRGLAPGRASASYVKNREVVADFPDDFYATEYYADFVMDEIDAARADGTPFFAYLAFSAPHWPYQVKANHIDLYKGQYSMGYDELYDQRIRSAKDLGIIPSDANEASRPSGLPSWDSIDHEERIRLEKSMELYAAVVERMDFHLGRVLAHLERSGQLRNTHVVFMSDNGAEGGDFFANPARREWLQTNWDLSVENMGQKGSYVYQGPGWARASVGPYRMFKSFVSEGGVKSPLIISNIDQKSPGALVHGFYSVKDITPTLLDFAGVEHPGDTYKGRSVTPLEGYSLRQQLRNPHRSAEGERIMGWELFGHRAIRKGDWKLLWLSSKPKWHQKAERSDQWGLYNLADDPGEVTNLVASHPEKFLEMQVLWEEYMQQQRILLPIWH